jgi:polar amino acid transport system permease protein
MLIGFPIDATVTLVVAIVIYQTAYLGEIVAAGIKGLPKGQAGSRKGAGPWLCADHVPGHSPAGALQRDPRHHQPADDDHQGSSLGSIIAVSELSYVMLQVNSNEVTKPLQIFGILAATYFILCFCLSQATNWLERRIARQANGPRGRGGAGMIEFSNVSKWFGAHSRS